MAKPRPKKLKTSRVIPMGESREARQMITLQIMNAILDDPELHVSSAKIEVTQHSGMYLDYITLNMSDVTEERYDVLRRIVNGAGGSVSITERNDLGNVRVWPEGTK